MVLVRTLELYHRFVFGAHDRTDAEHQSRLRVIAWAVPDGYREWAVEGLQFRNEPPLRRRLTDLLRRYDRIVGISRHEIDRFADRVATTRNYITHRNPELASRAATEGVEIYRINQRLSLLLQMCLLTETGLGIDDIQRFVMRRATASGTGGVW
jgi:hypothetical protein